MPNQNLVATVNNPQVIVAATDGACSGNPGPGGWAAILRFKDGSIEEFGGHFEETTNNRMELLAVLKTLEKLKGLPRKPGLTIKTDSKYVIDGLSKWMANWKKNGWRTASGKPVLNQDLWKALDNAQLDDVKLKYVKGHSGDIDNDRVDQIAVSYSKGLNIKLDVDNSSNTAPIQIKELVTRLDMISHIARQGYSLSMKELSELLGVPVEEIRVKNNSWQWRDWLIKPTRNGLWKLQASNNTFNCKVEVTDD